MDALSNVISTLLRNLFFTLILGNLAILVLSPYFKVHEVLSSLEKHIYILQEFYKPAEELERLRYL